LGGVDLTAIAGFVHEGSVWIGGDSAGVSGWDMTIRADRKVFVKGDFVIGFTSSFRMGQLIRYKFNLPQHPDGMDVFEFMATLFVDGLRQCFKDGGYAEKDKEAEKGGVFLVGYRGRLFRIDSDYQVGEPLDGMDACGCGDQIVRGALWALRDSGDQYERMITALSAAERFSAGVRGPFYHEVVV
jgi:hypothetical protein